MVHFLRGAKRPQTNSLTASCRGVLLCLKLVIERIIRSLKTRLLLSNSFSFTVFHSNWQYFTHSNSQQFTVIHCDEPNTGFEPRLISAYFFARWSGWRLPFCAVFCCERAFSRCNWLKKTDTSYASAFYLCYTKTFSLTYISF